MTTVTGAPLSVTITGSKDGVIVNTLTVPLSPTFPKLLVDLSEFQVSVNPIGGNSTEESTC